MEIKNYMYSDKKYWIRCKICNCRLSQGRLLDLLFKTWLNIKIPNPILVLDTRRVANPEIIFLCSEDREWVLKNKDAASAILGARLT